MQSVPCFTVSAITSFDAVKNQIGTIIASCKNQCGE